MKKLLLQFLKIIPSSKVISYKQLWDIFWLHPRTVAKILSSNNKQNIYPCYKVVNSNWKIGWYNLWIEEKIKLLKKDWIIFDKTIPKHHFWKPKIFNMFVAIPITETEKFQNLYYSLKKVNNWSFSIQNPKSPHITIKFFWQIDIKSFHKIADNLENNHIIIKKNKNIIFDKINNFNNRVWFLTTQNTTCIKEVYFQFYKINNLVVESKKFIPHLTVIRVKNYFLFKKIKKKVLNILSDYKFYVKMDKIRFYIAVDNIYQVPIRDVTIF